MTQTRVLFALTIAVIAFGAVNCLKCYTCGNDMSCNDLFVPNNTYLVECSSNSSYCIKSVYYGIRNGVVRGCADECHEHISFQKSEVIFNYCCNSTACNSSYQVASNFHLTSLALFVFLFISAIFN